ncbi:MAG: D-xylose 1-dehydrogenase Gfo6 [Halobacteriaceae archaeon]
MSGTGDTGGAADVAGLLEGVTRRDWQATDPDEGSVRLAMVGVGWWTRERALPAVETAELCETTTLVSGSPDRAAAVAADYGAEVLTYEEYHDGAEAAEYDAVYVCTPNATHLEHVEAAAAHGKAVLCEKPMEASPERAASLVAACREAGVELMVAYRMHTEPAVRRARELLRRGVVGEPAVVHGTMTQPVLELAGPDAWRLDPDLVGRGSSLNDIGIYPLNTTRFLLDADPVAVTASLGSEHDAFEEVPDERAAVTVEYGGGVRAAFTAGQNAAFGSFLEVVGTAGRVRVEPAFFPWEDRSLSVTRGGTTADVDFEQVDQMTEEFDYFADCLLAGRDPHPDGEHGLRDMRAIEAVYEAADAGRRIEV